MLTVRDRCGTNSPSLRVRTAAQHHQGVGEGAEKDTERDLVSAVAG